MRSHRTKQTPLLIASLLVLTIDFPSGQSGKEGPPPEQLRLTPDEQGVNRRAGELFVIFCTKEGDRERYTDLEWLGPQGLEITDNETASIRVVNFTNGLALHFRTPTPDNSGRYTCRTSSSETSAEIRFFYDVFNDCPVRQELILGRNGTIHCTVNGNPFPAVLWSNGTRGDPLKADRYTIEGGSLKIFAVNVSDRGVYVVEAADAAGNVHRRNITVDVIAPATITELADVTSITAGTTGRAVCSASGVPPPRCYWTDFRGRNLSTVAGFRVLPRICRLEIMDASIEHAGLYVCLATNARGSDARETRIEVIVAPKITKFQTATADENGKATLECRANGKPVPEIQIFNENAPTPLGQNRDKEGLVRLNYTLHDPNTATLVASISSVQRGHAGRYYCLAKNRAGRNERGIKLSVNFAPRLTAKDNPVYTWSNRPATLTCYVQALPKASVEWSDLDGNSLRDRTTYKIKTKGEASMLTVTGQAGRHKRHFVCVARNNLGEGSLVFAVREARRPGAPGQPKVIGVNATTATFELPEIISDGGMPILLYVIKYWREDQDPDEAKIKAFNNLTDSALTLVELEPLTKYFVTFSARSKIGEGPPSQQLSIQTTEQVAPYRPIKPSPKEEVSNDPGEFPFSDISVPALTGLVVVLLFVVAILYDALCLFPAGRGLRYAVGHLLCYESKDVDRRLSLNEAENSRDNPPSSCDESDFNVEFANWLNTYLFGRPLYQDMDESPQGIAEPIPGYELSSDSDSSVVG